MLPGGIPYDHTNETEGQDMGSKRKNLRAASIKLPMDLYVKIQQAAEANHRSVSGQIAFFCAERVAPVRTAKD